MVQNRLEIISYIITVDDEESQEMLTNSDIIDQVLAKDFHSHEQIHLGTDEETIQLVNMLRFAEQTHQGVDTDTLDLVHRLQQDANNEAECNQRAQQIIYSTNLALTNKNFPPLQNPNSQQ